MSMEQNIDCNDQNEPIFSKLSIIKNFTNSKDGLL